MNDDDAKRTLGYIIDYLWHNFKLDDKEIEELKQNGQLLTYIEWVVENGRN